MKTWNWEFENLKMGGCEERVLGAKLAVWVVIGDVTLKRINDEV